MAEKERRKVAFFAALTRGGTEGVRASEFIPELKKLIDLEVFDRVPRQFDPEDFEAIFYQIGNDPSHAWIYDLALRHPGIAVLQAADLHEIIRARTGSQSAEYLREVTYEIFGRDGEQFANPVLDFRGQQPRRFSMLRRLLDQSVACIVPDGYTESSVRMKGFRGKMARIPHGATVRTVDGALVRERLGIGKSRPLLGIFGDSGPELGDRIQGRFPEAAIVTVKDVANDGDLIELIATCDVVLSHSPALTALAFGLGKTVVLSATEDSDEYPDNICVRIACDEYRDEVLLQSLEWLLSSHSITAEIGASAARWVAGSRTWQHIARQFADFLTTESSPAPAMDATALGNYLQRWVTPGTPNARYLEEHADRLIRTLHLIPPGDASARILEMGCYLQITPALRYLLNYNEIRGCYQGSGGCDLKMTESRDGEFFECAIDLFNCERDPFPYPDGYFSAVLCCELLEHLEQDPMFMMGEIHRILRPDGVLLLTTPNITSLRSVAAILAGCHPGFYTLYPNPGADVSVDSRHQREYTTEEIAALFSASGFTGLQIETGPYGAARTAGAESAARALEATGQPAALRGDCIFALGRRAPNSVDRYPSWLYDSGRIG